MISVIENDMLRVVVAPGRGAGVLGFFAWKQDSWLKLHPDSTEVSCDLEWADFLMMPYSNRIENGCFSFGGKTFTLRNGEDHAIHGDVRERPWLIEESDNTSLRCVFHSGVHADINWPWPFEARVEYSLNENMFSSLLVLRNVGEEQMPAGFGWHPYFNRQLTRDDSRVELQFSCESVYPDANDNRIPSGPAEDIPQELDFSAEKELPVDQSIDNCYCGYDGRGSITWPDSGVRIDYNCSDTCSHLVLYNPVGKPYFAVEPVTNANNGVNLLAAGDQGSGVVVLDADESLEARFDMKVTLL